MLRKRGLTVSHRIRETQEENKTFFFLLASKTASPAVLPFPDFRVFPRLSVYKEKFWARGEERLSPPSLLRAPAGPRGGGGMKRAVNQRAGAL